VTVSRRILTTVVLAAGCAVAVAGCGSTRGLIPPANASALERDFAEVARAAEQGECTGAKEMIERTETDFAALPGSVAAPLRQQLASGIANLRSLTFSKCLSAATTTTSTTSSTATTTETTSRSTSTTRTTTASETTTSESQTSQTATERPTVTATPSPPNGGTPVPEKEGEGGGTSPLKPGERGGR